ncbi:hypothetical protein I6F36_20310 [Bradyrhizobium sp. BRP19]|uniref:hypothetical protein n=1 Tax=Bradyrhizobium sp. BRP19 TaxID=2793823 RepID=UPI001CD6AF9B|nr:hypothetical protein [Bradyrhizobium sp. BRP19]MCA1549176.1 hypothetical protein [Bradyrhizobium sp. BRP19]
MTNSEDEQSEFERRQLEDVYASVAADLQRAEPIYSHAINALWAGNGAASLAVATAMKGGGLGKAALLPLACFLLGLICMCAGSMESLIRLSSTVRRKERASSILQFRIDDFKSPSETAGLSLRHPRTRWALIAGSLFILGCIFGFLVLAFDAGTPTIASIPAEK